ncbi:MAG: Spy/CpxP family protein refolding chaperone, partial [Candidatus Caenarcaniphilales bacterium]|nr:Spy/CpxP family protein refolding chaperone [Candidatus Caenarcaniphilales bacterium]
FFSCLVNTFGFAKSSVDDFSAALASLNLSPEQEQQIEKIRKEHAKEAQPLKQDLLAKQEQLKSLLNQDSSSDEEIANLRNQINLADSKLTQSRKETRKKIKAILTDEQKNKLRDIQFKR